MAAGWCHVLLCCTLRQLLVFVVYDSLLLCCDTIMLHDRRLFTMTAYIVVISRQTTYCNYYVVHGIRLLCCVCNTELNTADGVHSRWLLSCNVIIVLNTVEGCGTIKALSWRLGNQLLCWHLCVGHGRLPLRCNAIFYSVVYCIELSAPCCAQSTAVALLCH